MMTTIDALTAEYLRLRDKKKAAEQLIKERLKPLNTRMTEIENNLLEYLNEQGLNSAPNDSGTPYKTTRTNLKIHDWSSTLQYIKDNELWHMLYHNLAKTEVEEFLEEHGELPPGVAINRSIVVNVKGAKK